MYLSHKFQHFFDDFDGIIRLGHFLGGLRDGQQDRRRHARQQ